MMAKKSSGTRRRGTRRRAPESPDSGGSQSPRELIVITNPEADVRASARGVAASAADVTGLERILSAHGANMTPLFGVAEERLRVEAARTRATAAAPVPDLSVYYRVEAPDHRLDQLAQALRREG